MRTTTTLENVINQVHEQSASHYDNTIAVRDMRFESLERMDIAGQSVGVLPSAQRLLANRLRVPFSYLNRCPRELQAENLNFWIRQEARNRQSFFVRFVGNSIRAVFSQRYTVIDHMEVLTKMLEYGFDPAAEVHLSLDSEIMVLKVPEYDRLFRLPGNDRIVPGISVTNSETGLACVTISAWFLRVVCTNGLIAEAAIDARYKHISRKVMDEFPMVLEGAVSQSRNGHDRFLISTQTTVSDPESTINSFCRQFQIPQGQAEIVKQAFNIEPGSTMYWVIQAFTRASQDRSLSASDAYRLERAGGAIMGMLKA